MAKKVKMDDFMRALGRLPDEDFVTVDEFYKMFNAVLDGIKASKVDTNKTIGELNKVAEKEAKKLEGYFKELLLAVDKRMKKVKDGKDGKDGKTPISGVDYPDYKEIRSFIVSQVDRALPDVESTLRSMSDPYQIARSLEKLEGNERISSDAVNGLDDKIEEQFRLIESKYLNKPQFVGGGGGSSTTVSGGTTSPLTTKGDLWGYSSTNARIPVGANNTVLTADSSQALGVKWAVPAGGGDVAKVGTPVDSQIGVWTGDGTIEGTANFTYDGSNMQFTGDLGSTGTRITKGWFADLVVTNAIAGDITGNAGTVTNGVYTGDAGSVFLAPDGDGSGLSGILLPDGDGSGLSGVVTAETDPVVGAITGIVKADGAGSISSAIEDTDYQGVLTEGAFEDGDKSKLDNIEASADVTDEANVKSALNGATTTEVDPASGDKILILDASDSDNLKHLTYSDFATATQGTTADNALPVAGGTMTGDIQLGETDIKLDATLSGDEKWSGIVVAGTLGSTVATGEICFLASDGKWDKVDGIVDGTDTGFNKQLGICLAGGDDTDATEMLLYGKVRSAGFPSFSTVGAPVYLSDTAGDITETAPSTTNHTLRIVGFSLSADELMFNPSNDWVVHA